MNRGLPFGSLSGAFSWKGIFYQDIEGPILLQDSGGLVMDRIELESLFQRAMAGIDEVGNEAIEAHNQSLLDQINAPHVAPKPKIDKSNSPEVYAPPRQGFVYLMSNGHRWKIGISTNPDSRLRQIRMQSGFDVELIASCKFEDARAMELELHAKYADKRIAGEWFDLSPADVDEICEVLGHER